MRDRPAMPAQAKDAMLERRMERFRSQNSPPRFLVVPGALGLAALVLLARSPGPAYAYSDAPRHGAEVFASSGCTHCHGVEGMGTERGPALRDVRKHLSAEEIEHQIVAGGREMPAFGETLDHQQVTDLVAFLRAKKWVSAPSVAQPAPAPTP